MTNTFHQDWLRRFREDLRTGDMESLAQDVELAGLETVLDPEFLALASQEDARAVVVLIATLGEANTDEPERFVRWRAAYQYLQGQCTLEDAAAQCASANDEASGYYVALLACVKERTPMPALGAYRLHAQSLAFGIELLTNTGHSTQVLALLKAWQSVDPSDMPWLRTCRAVAARKQRLHTRQEAASLAQTTQCLIDQAPKQQAVVVQEMRVLCADLALKARDGAMACRAAQQAFDHDQDVERRFTLAKAHILRGDLPNAIGHMHALLLHTLSEDFTHEAVTPPVSHFDVLAAEDSLIRVNEILRAKGLQPFLMSGTLLGYAREGALLAHDKDIDIGIIGWEDQFTVAQALVEAGHFQFDLAQLTGKDRFLISAYDLRNGMAVDFFLFHDKGDHFLHGIDFDMGFTQNFRFSKFGLNEVEFLDEAFWVPDDIERNLTENYGDWHTPVSSYVVTVESPALCESSSRTLLVYMEILKTITKGLKPQRAVRILDYLEEQRWALFDEDVHANLRQWCAAHCMHGVVAVEMS